MSSNYLLGSKLPSFGNYAVRNYNFLKGLLYIPEQPSLLRAPIRGTHSSQKYVEFKEISELCNHPEKLLIDVRDAEEYRVGRIPRSINIPLDSLAKEMGPNTSPEEFKEKYKRKKPDLGTYIITSCHCGDRAVDAADILKGLGYTNVHVYFGSWLNYCKNVLKCN